VDDLMCSCFDLDAVKGKFEGGSEHALNSPSLTII